MSAPQTADEWKNQGNEAVKKGDHAAAYVSYSGGLKVEPDHAILLSNRALSLLKLDRDEEAAADALRCTILRPDFMKGFLRGAMALEKLGRPQAALDLLRKSPKNEEIEQFAAKLKPQAEAAEKKRMASLGGAEKKKEEGNALFKKGMFEQALEVYSAALKLCKDQTEEMALAIRNNRAGCYSQLSNFHAVVEETNFVIEQQPDNAKALMRRMQALEPLEKYEAALTDARHVLRLLPGNDLANKLQHRLGKLVRDKQKADVKLAGA